MTLEDIKRAVISVAERYHIKKATLFGSRALGIENKDSDVDLIFEFDHSVSLITLMSLKYDLEELLGVSVDVVHGPIREGDMIIVNKEVVLYDAA